MDPHVFICKSCVSYFFFIIDLITHEISLVFEAINDV